MDEVIRQRAATDCEREARKRPKGSRLRRAFQATADYIRAGQFERVDTAEDLAAREKMLDEVERRFWERGLNNLDRIKDQSHG